MKQALENATDADRAAVNQMLGDLNELLEKHARGEDTLEDFADFMAKHGDFFPRTRRTSRAPRLPRPALRSRPADAELDVARAAGS